MADYVLTARPPYVVGNAPEGIPALCPITGLRFFSIERNPNGEGFVPTYGGPFESHTIPLQEANTETGYVWRTFDHDRNDWLDYWDSVPQELLTKGEEKGGICPTCHGAGGVDVWEDSLVCGDCHGTGHIPTEEVETHG